MLHFVRRERLGRRRGRASGTLDMSHEFGESSSHVQAGQAALDRSPLPNLEAPGD